MEVNGKLHSAATLHPGKEPLVPIRKVWLDPSDSD